MGSLRITTTLQPRGPAATIGDFTWRTTVTRMGGEFLLGMNKAVRQGAGAEAGDTVDVHIELDTAPREVEVPEALATALAGDAVARESYEGMAYTHRKEFARWIAEAKREDTRERRVAQALEMLREGRTRS